MLLFCFSVLIFLTLTELRFFNRFVVFSSAVTFLFCFVITYIPSNKVCVWGGGGKLLVHVSVHMLICQCFVRVMSSELFYHI